MKIGLHFGGTGEGQLAQALVLDKGPGGGTGACGGNDVQDAGG